MVEALITGTKLLIVREVEEDASGAVLRFQQGSQGRLGLGQANYAAHLRLARRSQERQHPVGVSFGEGQIITELIRADNDVPSHLWEEDPGQARVLFQGHDGVFRLRAGHPESARIRTLLGEALRQKARVWFIAQKPDLALLDALPSGRDPRLYLEIKPELQRFLQHMPQGDDLTLIVLKGHLLVEEALERIIRKVVAHGDLVDEARLSFAQKAVLARAMCWTKHDSDMWELVTSLNSLRNDLVHQLDSPRFQDRLRKALQAQGAAIDEDADRERMKAEPVPDQLRFAILYLLGFLGRYEEDAGTYRVVEDRMLQALSSGPA